MAQPPRTLLNLGLIALLTLIVLIGGINQRRSSNAALGSVQPRSVGLSQPSSIAIDKAATVYIATNVATRLELPVMNEIIKHADDLNTAPAAVVNTDSAELDKPEIVATDGEVSREVQTYVTSEGETLAQVAAKFNISTETLTWANNLSSGELLPNTELRIPPVNGVLYTVEPGDSVPALAERFQARPAEIVAFNDLEVAGLSAGQRIMIPYGVKPDPLGSAVQAPLETRMAFAPSYIGNGYDWGWCTWWAAERRRQLGAAIPSNWGNANTWDDLASASGYRLSSIPRAGAIFQTDAGWAGHVGVVEEVSRDGSKVKVSDMNGYAAGWGQTPSREMWVWMPASSFETYIY